MLKLELHASWPRTTVSHAYFRFVISPCSLARAMIACSYNRNADEEHDLDNRSRTPCLISPFFYAKY